MHDRAAKTIAWAMHDAGTEVISMCLHQTPVHAQDAAGVVVTVGGTSLADLEQLGVAAVFTPGARTADIIDFMQLTVQAR